MLRTGTIKSFNPHKAHGTREGHASEAMSAQGWGFIECGGRDVFLYKRDLKGVCVEQGQQVPDSKVCILYRAWFGFEVQFTMIQNERGPQAQDVTVLVSPDQASYFGEIKSFNPNKGRRSSALALCKRQCHATYCNILQHIATYCNILQHIATYCNIHQQKVPPKLPAAGYGFITSEAFPGQDIFVLKTDLPGSELAKCEFRKPLLRRTRSRRGSLQVQSGHGGSNRGTGAPISCRAIAFSHQAKGAAAKEVMLLGAASKQMAMMRQEIRCNHASTWAEIREFEKISAEDGHDGEHGRNDERHDGDDGRQGRQRHGKEQHGVAAYVHEEGHGQRNDVRYVRCVRYVRMLY